MGVYIKGIKTPAIVKVHYLNGRRYVEDPRMPGDHRSQCSLKHSAVYVAWVLLSQRGVTFTIND